MGIAGAVYRGRGGRTTYNIHIRWTVVGGIDIAVLGFTSLVGFVVVPGKEEQSIAACRVCDLARFSRFSRFDWRSSLPRRPSLCVSYPSLVIPLYYLSLSSLFFSFLLSLFAREILMAFYFWCARAVLVLEQPDEEILSSLNNIVSEAENEFGANLIKVDVQTVLVDREYVDLNFEKGGYYNDRPILLKLYILENSKRAF